MKVIIADDSLTMRTIIRNMLADIGHTECLTADGGDVVMELLDAHEDVGLVLMDWNMPVMNGLECLRAIRARERTAKLPVVMVSSEVMRDKVVEALQAGASNYLIKPFDSEKFKAVVAGALERA